ncbi:MAG: hypothetical protein IPK33_25670 [Gemmatimonadetes bacterium]|nr:hypothetical protein [Gemmatimonadota bacterium]
MSDADLNAQVLTARHGRHVRVLHDGVGTAERFATVEQPTLQPLPTSPYRTGLVALPPDATLPAASPGAAQRGRRAAVAGLRGVRRRGAS